MIGEEQFRMEILADFDEAGLTKDFEQLIDKVNSSAANKLKESMDEMQKSGAVDQNNSVMPSNSKNKNDGGLMEFFKTGLRGLKGIMGFVAKIAATIGILSSVFKVLEPAIEMLQQISDMVAMFLQPISDIFVTLLAPIMTALRPMIQVFQTLMMPFRRLAMEGLASSNQLIGEGTREILEGDPEKGKAMVGEGIEGAISSASLLLSGFADVILGPFKDIEAFGIGKAIDDGISSWQDKAIGGVFKVTESADWLFNEIEDYTTLSVEAIRGGFKLIDETVDAMSDKIGGFTIDNWGRDMDTVQGELDRMFEPLNKLLNASEDTDDKGLNKLMEDFNTELENTRDILPSVVGTLGEVGLQAGKDKGVKNIDLMTPSFVASMENVEATSGMEKFLDVSKVTFKKLGENIKSNFESGNIANLFTGSLVDTALDAPEIGKEASVDWKSLDEARKKHFENFKELYPKITKSQEDGLIKQLKFMNLYWGNSLIPDSFRSGLEHTHNIIKEFFGADEGIIPLSINEGLINTNFKVNSFFGEKGSVITTFNTGLVSMDKKTNSFGTSLKKVTGLLDDATRRMENYARKYNNAVRRIDSLQSNIRNMRNV